jgi:hypothetical protein
MNRKAGGNVKRRHTRAINCDLLEQAILRRRGKGLGFIKSRTYYGSGLRRWRGVPCTNKHVHRRHVPSYTRVLIADSKSFDNARDNSQKNF